MDFFPIPMPPTMRNLIISALLMICVLHASLSNQNIIDATADGELVLLRRITNSKLSCNQNSITHLSNFPFHQIYLSIVVELRNKDVNGLHFRLSHFLKNIGMGCTAYSICDEIEIVIVDFNSDPTYPPLESSPSIRWPRRLPLVKFAIVPSETARVIQQALGYNHPVETWEFVAKNIGIRRACGRFILSTKPDDLFPMQFYNYISKKRLSQYRHYRVPMCYLKKSLPPGSLAWSYETISEFITKSVLKCHSMFLVKKMDSERPFPMDSNSIDVIPDVDHGHVEAGIAAGDFLLMHRRAWAEVRGYPEVGMPHTLDTSILAWVLVSGYNLSALPAPIATFHQYHSRAYRMLSHQWKGSKSRTEAIGMSFVTDMMHETNRALFINDEDWGYRYANIEITYK